jgi:hypothetical protein
MLRITINDDAEVKRLILEGRMTGEWVKEVEACWHRARAAPSPPRILVELRDVRFVDEEGRNLLRLMAQSGVVLVAGDLLMRATLEEITA